MRITIRPALSGAMLLALMMLLLSCPRLLRAQQLDDNASGTTYIIAFPDTVTSYLDPRLPSSPPSNICSLFLYSASGENRVRISSAGNTSTVTLDAGKFLTYQVNAAPIVSLLNAPQSNTVRIEAERPIVVYCYMFMGQSCEAWTPIPVEQWGTRYNIACTAGDYVNNIGVPGETSLPLYPMPAPAEFLVIAAYNNTHVTIFTHGRPLEGNPGLDITLRQGEVYQVQSYVDSLLYQKGMQADIAGTRIVADKPIGVISGNTRTSVTPTEGSVAGNFYKDMLMEWLPPVESQGTEFIYMPTWDSHRPGINAPAERTGDVVRLYGTGEKATGASVMVPGGAPTSYVVARDTMRELLYGEAQAVYMKTDQPAMAMMESGTVVKLESSTPCFGNVPCLRYSAVSSHMVELTPREQWVSFAPYYAPPASVAMQHFINVVCDTSDQGNIYTESGVQFLFTRRIPGTGLIWGTQGVSPGQSHYLVGRNGARFGGFVYGMGAGKEEYRPGGGSSAYTEVVAPSYGYPLAPGRRLLLPADTYRIDTVRDCDTLHIALQALNASPVGLRSVTIDPPSAINAWLVAVDPPRLNDLAGSATGKVDLVPIDPLRDATATVIVRDRTGAVHYVYYAYSAQRLDVNRSVVDFGELAPGQRREDTIAFTNPLNRAVDVASVALAVKSAGFSITSITPSAPVSLPPGGRLTVVIAARPATGDAVTADSVKVALGCAVIAVPLRVATVQPIIVANDLDFGTMRRGDPARSLPLNICNTGRGTIIFGIDTGSVSSAALTWGDPGFSVSQSALDSLRGTWIAPGGCIRIPITFDPATAGEHRTTARARTNARSMKDTSLWKAVVIDAPLDVDDAATGGEGYRLESVRPNPAGGRMEIAYRLKNAGPVTLEIYDATGQRVALLADGVQSAGEHLMAWDAGTRPGGLYFCRISSGGWNATQSMIVVR